MNVHEATLKRLEFIFSEFDNVLISLSGGKDSGVCFNLCYDYAKATNQLDKLAVYTMDYEGGYNLTREYLQHCFDNYPEIKRKYWLCLPISAQCAVSMHQTYWTPWDKDKQDVWIFDMPKNDYIINEDNAPFEFKKNTYGKDARANFTKWFSSEYGKTAVIIGLRMDESLNRRAAITSQHRAHMYNGVRYSKKQNDTTFNFYPIYDWTTEDIWVANAKFGWSYNKLYDLLYQAGISIHDMRTASPFNSHAQRDLKQFKVIEPSTWGRMVSRVNGVNFTGIYGGTTAMGWNKIKKPKHFTWKQYAMFLIDTLPPQAKDNLLYHLDRIAKSWEQEGYGRNPRVIAQMEKEGVVLEKTGEIAKNCTKDDIYEIVKIKSGIPDETEIPMFRKVPSWKGVCITILKNDFTLQYMGVSRSKKQLKQRNEAIKKYKEII